MFTNRQIYFILIVLCFLVYANSLNNAFVSDDIDAIVKNQFILRPLYSWLSPSDFLNSLIHSIAGNNPYFYHLANIILHSIATIFVFFFLRLFFKLESSFLAACLFAAHPIHTEAVTWVAGRPYIFMALFMLGSYFLYHSAVNSEIRGRKFRPLPYLLCLLLCSYYIVLNFGFYFLFPLLLVLSDFTFGRWRKNWKWWLPFFAIVILRMVLARGIIADRIATVAKETGRGGGAVWTNPVYNMAYSIFANLSLIIWPAKLTLYHEPPVITRFLLNWELATLALVVVALPFIFKKAKPVFFAIALYVIFLAPTYSPVMISWLVAERYVYLPSIAFVMLAAFCYERYVGRSEKAPRLRLPALAVFIFIIAAYGVRTVARNEDWKTPGRFWRQTLLVSSYSPRAHNNMGDIYAQEGNTQGAIAEFKKSIELRPDYADAYHNLANMYQYVGNLQEAVINYQKALSFKPLLFESQYNLGIIYLNSKQINEAIEHLNRAVKLRPEDTAAKFALKIAMEKQPVK